MDYRKRSGNSPIYDTDPDSRMMRVSNNGADVAHNVQIAVDEKNHMVVAVDVTSQPINKEQLHNMAVQAKENLGVDELTIIADRGYYSANEFELCENDNIHPIVDKRTKENIELYRKRQQLVEHPFGTVKRALGFTYFLMRGSESVRVESCLHFLIYNIKRVINIMGTHELKAVLQR